VDGEGGWKRPGVAERNRRTGRGGLYDNPPVFGDFTLCLVVQSTCTEPRDALRKCLPSVPHLSRPYIARRRRVGGTPMLSLLCLPCLLMLFFVCLPCLSCGGHQKHTDIQPNTVSLRNPQTDRHGRRNGPPTTRTAHQKCHGGGGGGGRRAPPPLHKPSPPARRGNKLA